MRLGFHVAFPTCGVRPHYGCVHFTTFGFEAWALQPAPQCVGDACASSLFLKRRFLKAEAAAYSGVDSGVARTKRNDEMKKKRVSRRLGEAEDKTECDDPSICVLDDLAVDVVMCVPLGRPAQRMAGVLGVQCWLGLLYTTLDCTLLVVQWGPLSLMLFNGPTPTM